MRAWLVGRSVVGLVCLSLVGGMLLPGVAYAKTAAQIDASVNASLVRFKQQVRGATELLQRARGVLVFAGVVKAGVGVGAEYGEGALRIRGKTAAYYSLTSASVGFQLGIQQKDIILVFLEDRALRDFRASDGWKIGVDGSVVLVNVGAGGSIDTAKLNKPIVGFVVGQKGLMYNLTLEGSKISRLRK